MTIKQINDKNLIITKEDETYFFNVNDESGLKIRQQFLTVDGYEEGINIKLSFDELQALSKTINSIIEKKENGIDFQWDRIESELI